MCLKVIILFDRLKKFLVSRLSRELAGYILAGVATTLINWIAYWLFINLCTPTVSNIIAWAISVIFAYCVNSRYVFEAKPDSVKCEMKLFCEFVMARITSGVVETACVYIFIERLMFNDFGIKIALSVFVIVFNYLVSKLWIFPKREKR